jgi:hypothetical protein
MNVILEFIKTIRRDYYNPNSKLSKSEKLKTYRKIVNNLFLIIWNQITAPLIYPIWWLFKKEITNKIYSDISIEEISKLISTNQTQLVKQIIKNKGTFLYWLWTYGDQEDPLGRGGMPEWFGNNTFINRFNWAAIRNPRFNINYLEFRTNVIIDKEVIIDTRSFDTYHKSKGIGDSPDGIYFKWLKDIENNWYFIYEDNSKLWIWYFGWTGLLLEDIGNGGGRFEFSLRKTESTYNN